MIMIMTRLTSLSWEVGKTSNIGSSVRLGQADQPALADCQPLISLSATAQRGGPRPRPLVGCRRITLRWWRSRRRLLARPRDSPKWSSLFIRYQTEGSQWSHWFILFTFRWPEKVVISGSSPAGSRMESKDGTHWSANKMLTFVLLQDNRGGHFQKLSNSPWEEAKSGPDWPDEDPGQSGEDYQRPVRVWRPNRSPLWRGWFSKSEKHS